MFYSEKYDCFIDNDGCIYCYPDPKASRQPKEKLFQPYQYIDPNGYKRVQIHGKSLYVHRLYMESFVPNPNNLPQIDHLDNNQLNNNWETNLRWCTASQNQLNRRDYRSKRLKKLSKALFA